MALKSKITDKAEFDKLSDVVKGEYKEDNGVWLLQTDEAAELLAAKNREAAARKDAEDRLKVLQQEKDAAIAAETEAKEAKARKDKDVETLELSWAGKVQAAKDEAAKKIDTLTNQLKQLLVDAVAMTLATELSTVPAVFAGTIATRLRADVDGEKPLTRVLDAAGNVTALSLDDLKKEILATSAYAGILKGTNANGGSAGNAQTGGSATGNKKFNDMTEAERVTLSRTNNAEYRRLATEAGVKLPS